MTKTPATLALAITTDGGPDYMADQLRQIAEQIENGDITINSEGQMTRVCHECEAVTTVSYSLECDCDDEDEDEGIEIGDLGDLLGAIFGGMQPRSGGVVFRGDGSTLDLPRTP